MTSGMWPPFGWARSTAAEERRPLRRWLTSRFVRLLLVLRVAELDRGGCNVRRKVIEQESPTAVSLLECDSDPVPVALLVFAFASLDNRHQVLHVLGCHL